MATNATFFYSSSSCRTKTKAILSLIFFFLICSGDKHCEKYILTMKCIGEIEIDTYKSGQKIVQSDQYIILHGNFKLDFVNSFI